MKNLLLQLWQKKYFDINRSDGFEEIIGHNDIKKILNNAIHSKKAGSHSVGWRSGFGKDHVFATYKPAF